MAYAGLWAWNWYFGDDFGTGPADAPNALEARSVRFSTIHPDGGATISVHADLITGDGEAVSGDIAVAQRREANYIRVDAATWRVATPDEQQAHRALFLAIDSSMVRTLDDVFPRAVWQHLSLTEQQPTTAGGPTFVASASLDVTNIGTEFSDSALGRAFPIPRISSDASAASTALEAQQLIIDVSAEATAGVTPTTATRLGLTPGTPTRMTIVVDDVGVVRSITSGEAGNPRQIYTLLDARADRPTQEQSTELGDIPPSVPMGAALDLVAMTRDSIGPRRFDRIVEHTGVTMAWGAVGNYDAKAYWNESNGFVTMNVRVAGFWSGKREDLLAHELAHIAAFGAGIRSSGSHECLADIIASHWLGYKVEAGAYDYRHCATHGDAERVLALYG